MGFHIYTDNDESLYHKGCLSRHTVTTPRCCRQQDVVLITKDISQHVGGGLVRRTTLTQNELWHFWQKQKVDQQKCHVYNLWKDRVSPLRVAGRWHHTGKWHHTGMNIGTTGCLCPGTLFRQSPLDAFLTMLKNTVSPFPNYYLCILINHLHFN